MKINSYNQEKYKYINEKQNTDDIKNKNISDKKEQKNMNAITNSTDSIEISDNYKKLNSIKSKLESGFYDAPDVLQKVAEKIINTI